mgnify:CR=1 FL=1
MLKKGFSIKSEIGSPATVFNSSHSTNLTFRILGNGKPKTFSKVSAVKTNVESLRNADLNFSLKNMTAPFLKKV